MVRIRVTKRRDGRTVFWLREPAGRVTIGNPNRMNWVRARMLRDLTEYGIGLIKERVSKGIGSDDAPMPPLKAPQVRFKERVNGIAQFTRKRIRNLYGPGNRPPGSGHMLDHIRVSHMDDRRCEFSITDTASRAKARNNERLAPWWGWSPSDMRKMAAKFQEIFQTGFSESLMTLGLASVRAVASSAQGLARAIRRVA